MNDFAAIINELQAVRHYYESGVTKSYAFRKQQLLLLNTILPVVLLD